MQFIVEGKALRVIGRDCHSVFGDEPASIGKKKILTQPGGLLSGQKYAVANDVHQTSPLGRVGDRAGVMRFELPHACVPDCFGTKHGHRGSSGKPGKKLRRAQVRKWVAQGHIIHGQALSKF